MLSGIGSELAQNPILALFVVIGLGYLLGELNLFSFRLGVVGVLFMGIAVGALNPNIHIPKRWRAWDSSCSCTRWGFSPARWARTTDTTSPTRSGPAVCRLPIAGAVITLVVQVIVLVASYKWLKIPFDYLMGLSSGIQTQMTCVGFADEASRSDEPSIAYASIYPVAMITKIILAQLLL